MFARLKSSLGRIVSAVTLVSLLVGLALASSFKHAQLSSVSEIQSPNNVSELLERRASLAIRKSRNSAVNVMSISEEGTVSSSSGTYFTIDEQYYIITVSHGIVGECSSIRVVTDSGMFECIEIKILDRRIDYAIIQVDRIPGRIAVKIPADYPRANDWHSHLSIQRGTYYTGYPNGQGPLTFAGEISGHDSSENVYVHSFAWPGSSGSGVFSDSGKLIGIIVAISVGSTEFGIDVLEDIVIVIPLYKIDWDML